MKKILTGAVAAIALVGVASPAAAQTNQRHYAATVPVLGNLSQNNPGPGATFAWEFARGVFGIGTRYTAVADALDLSRDELVTLARNSILGAFLDDDAKARHLAAIDAYAALP